MPTQHSSMAALIFRCLVTWLCVVLVTIFILLHVDFTISWNWFLVFIPMWVYDLVVLIDLSLKLALRRRLSQSHSTQELNCARNIWRLVALTLKLTFQVLLCYHLEYGPHLRLVFVMIPFWCLMVGLIVEIGIFVFMNVWLTSWHTWVSLSYLDIPALACRIMTYLC